MKPGIELAHNRLMIDLEGPALLPAERELLQHPAVGAVILFARNVRDLQQVRALVAEIRHCRDDLLLAVDQEGGRVQRLREGFVALPPMAALGQRYQSHPQQALALSREIGWLMATEVLACDIDFSFAPVLDLGRPLSEVIGDRAFAEDADTVVLLSTAFLEGMREAGMASTGKHFPGHGGVAADSHHELPVDDRPLSEIEAEDMRVFADCLPLLDAVMPAHVLYPQADTHCAGFSRYWLQQVLRQRLGFDGVIFSDDLSMAGAAAAGDMAQRLHAAAAAGCDMLLICNNPPAVEQALSVIEGEPAAFEAPDSVRRLQRMRRRVTAASAQAQLHSPRHQRVAGGIKNLMAGE